MPALSRHRHAEVVKWAIASGDMATEREERDIINELGLIN
jgi:hypothetical protein